MANDPQLETRIALLEQEVKNITALYGKVDDTIEKMIAISDNLKTLLAAHEARLLVQHEKNEDLYDQIDNLKCELKELRSTLQTEIAGLHKELKNYDKIKWMFLGAAGVIGYLLNELNIFKLFK